ncbi:heavy metal translocating P-type ATPase [Cohnella faecalis]|uniref:heavy metal translocating P-type ATPase n=1 Tax=Cohnella faecalis TaxID=2315694 RepID=UPI0026A6969E|nr:cation-translocating P-type ATPase [Cohnella faecalis]
MFGLNELLEGYGSNKARRSMETLLDSAPKEAIRLDPVTNSETVLPIDQLKVGDIVIVKPGSSIPSDGTVSRGVSSVNEAAITGESLPVDKSEGDSVFGGSLNNEGILQVRIEKEYADSSLSRMLHLVQEAQETKTPTELFINRFARYYTPFIMIAALLVLLVPPLAFGGEWKKWLYEALAVLIVGCPCALILSSPVAILSGITRTARNGILIKGGAFLEQLGKLDTIAFDKTGTLTKGEPRVERTIVYDPDRFYPVAGAIERTSSHPLSKAIMRELSRFESETWEMERIETVAGVGVFGWRDGAEYRIGNEKSVSALALTESTVAAIREFKDEGLTLVIVSDAQNVLGLFGVADEIRAESAQAIRELNGMGIRTVMLTGDHARSADKVASAVGIQQWHAALLPENKATIIRDLAESATVGMVGDGINDAPALASAQLGIAMGKGTDAAIETADMVLMQDHLGKLPEAIRTGRQVNRIIRFNIGVALGLKLLALALAVPGLLTLWIAILSDMGATVFVTLVSLTLLLRSPRTP